METIADRLAATRRRRLMTQKELAQAAGVPIVTLSRIENGHNRPQMATIRKLAAALNVDPVWLAYGDSDDTKAVA